MIENGVDSVVIVAALRGVGPCEGEGDGRSREAGKFAVVKYQLAGADGAVALGVFHRERVDVPGVGHPDPVVVRATTS